MELHPPVQRRSTEELLKMASDHLTWSPEAMAMARLELQERGIPIAQIENRRTAFAKASIAHESRRQLNATKTYSLGEVLWITLISPFLIIGKLLSSQLPLDIKLGLSELDRRNFNRKYRQRMTALVFGVALWAILVASLL